MLRKILESVAAAMLLAFSPGAWAIETIVVLADPATMSDSDLRRTISQHDLALRTAGLPEACDVRPFIEELERRHPASNIETSAAYFAGLCLLHLGQPAEALAKLEYAEGLMPPSSTAQMAPAIDFMAFQAALSANNMEAASKHAVHVARRNSPEEFARLNVRQFRFVLFRAQKQQADAVGFAFARASAFASLPDDLQQTIAYRSVRPLLDDGERELALKMAGIMTQPTTYLRMLIDREFAPVWSVLEARAGPHMTNVAAANAVKAEAAMKAQPDNRHAFGDAVQALVYAHRYHEAVDLAGRLDISPQGLPKLQEGDGWALNAMVKALDALGRGGEADDVFDKLATLPSDGRGWMVNFVINRAERLVRQARWQEAMPAAELAVATAAKYGSPYAKEVAAVDRLCAAHGLEPRRDLREWWTEIDTGWRENVGAAVQGALCMGDRKAATAILTRALNDPEKQRDGVMLLQRKEVEFFRDTAFGLADPRRLMDSDPSLRLLFNRHGRDLPQSLLPNLAR